MFTAVDWILFWKKDMGQQRYFLGSVVSGHYIPNMQHDHFKAYHIPNKMQTGNQAYINAKPIFCNPGCLTTHVQAHCCP
jgi:hypothetical protein